MFITYYHNVVTTTRDEFDRRCSRVHLDAFASQIEFLVRRYVVISLDEMLTRLRSGQLSSKSVAITFDDGYYGVLAHALPVLLKYKVPATVFVVTNHTSNGRPLHFDEIEIAFRLTKQRSINFDFLGLGSRSLESFVSRVNCMRAAKGKLKLSPRRLELHAELLKRLAVDPAEAFEYARAQEKYRTMSWPEIREWTAAGMTVGSHTRSHRTLSQLDQADRQQEIRGSLADIHGALGLDSVPFAYPYGEMEHIGPAAPAMIREAGYSCALTTLKGANGPADNFFMMRRVGFDSLQWPV